MTRLPLTTRNIRLVGEAQRALAVELIATLPIDADRPLEVVLREEVRPRTPDQNARMWAGPLRDLAEQAWIDGRQFSAETWHEHSKREFLPEEDDPELPTLVKQPETYRKWDYTPKGERVCVGSTTQLTRRGFARYTEQIEALAAGLGVLLSGVV